LQGNPSPRLLALSNAMPGLRILFVLGAQGIVMASSEKALLREAISYGLFYGVLALLCCAGLYWMQNRRAQVRDRLQADQRMTLALCGANLGLWNFDVAAGALALDDNSLAIIGAASQESDANPAFWSDRIHRHDLPAYVAARDTCIDGSAPCYEVTYRILHQDGHWAWVLARRLGIAVGK
jgi:PAS domain-containing protein